MSRGASGKPTEPNDSLQISHYEDVTSWLVALLLFIGFFVTLLGLIWLTKVFEFKQVAIPIEFVEEKSGTSIGVMSVDIWDGIESNKAVNP